jgi:hypothetical protein
VTQAERNGLTDNEAKAVQIIESCGCTIVTLPTGRYVVRPPGAIGPVRGTGSVAARLPDIAAVVVAKTMGG